MRWPSSGFSSEGGPRLQFTRNRLEYILGRALEVECGISQLMFEMLSILGRAGEPGLSMRAVAQEQEEGNSVDVCDRPPARVHAAAPVPDPDLQRRRREQRSLQLSSGS